MLTGSLSTAMLLSPVRPALADTNQIGLVPAGQVGFSFVGKIEQNGTLADDFGYLTSISGLDGALMFTSSDPLSRSEGTARFTYFATAVLKTRSVNGTLFVTSGTAQTTLFFNEEGGASFDTPTSFKHGTVIATYTSVWHDIVNVQSPNMGVVRIESDDTQKTAVPFTLQGTQHQLGRSGLLNRLSFTGEGNRTDPILPRATILYAGESTVLPQGGIPQGPASAPGRTSGWAYAGFGLGLVALIVALSTAVGSRRRTPPQAGR